MFYRVKDNCSFVNGAGHVFGPGEVILIADHEIHGQENNVEPAEVPAGMKEALELPEEQPVRKKRKRGGGNTNGDSER